MADLTFEGAHFDPAEITGPTRFYNLFGTLNRRLPLSCLSPFGEFRMKAQRRIAVAMVVLLASATTGPAALGDEIADHAAGVAGSAWEAAQAASGGLWTAA